MSNLNFANPELLYLLVLLPLMLLWELFFRRKKKPSLQISTFPAFAEIKPTIRQRLRFLPFLFRLITVASIILALARPQSSSSDEKVSTEGIDIMIALDISTSMLAQDFKPNRLEAAKVTAMEFISSRKTDRIGLVVFAGDAFTQCPLTIDHTVLLNLFKDVKTGMVTDGTAMGDGLATSVARIKDSPGKSKVIILLTDGVNNMGSIAPLTAAEIANTFGIKVYTVGVGTRGQAPYPVQTPFGTQTRMVEVDIDEPTLTEIAQITGGKYWRATNTKALEEIYDEIDELEKTKIDVSVYHRNKDEFFPFLLLAIFALSLEVLLRYTLLKTLP